VSPVELQLQDDIAWIRFGDPEQQNRLTVAVLTALAETLQRAVDARARVIVLRGRGGLWSAGYDVARIPPEIFAADPETVSAHPFERCMAAVRACPVPLLAAVERIVFGGALELAISCDLVVAHSETRFGLTPARLGLIYSHTGLRTLLNRVGSAHARMLVFTAQTVDAAEAARMHLINEVCDVPRYEARVAELAERIAGCAPLSVRGMKQVLRALEEDRELSDATLREILELRHSAYQSADFREGQVAFDAKRDPRFRGS